MERVDQERKEKKGSGSEDPKEREKRRTEKKTGRAQPIMTRTIHSMQMETALSMAKEAKIWWDHTGRVT